MPTFLHGLAVVSVVGAGLFFLFTFGRSRSLDLLGVRCLSEADADDGRPAFPHRRRQPALARRRARAQSARCETLGPQPDLRPSSFLAAFCLQACIAADCLSSRLLQFVACVLALLYLVDSYPAKQTLLTACALLVYLVRD